MPRKPLQFTDPALFDDSRTLSQKKIVGSIVREILYSGLALTRKNICIKLVAYSARVTTREEKHATESLLKLLFIKS